MFYNLLRSVNQYLINIAFIKLNARGLMNFDLQDLRLLVNTVEEGSLTSGARRSHLSPAAGSARLRQLEVAVGGLLFYREHRGMEATPLGIKMLQHARQILRHVEHAKLEISNLKYQTWQTVPQDTFEFWLMLRRQQNICPVLWQRLWLSTLG
jgi:hypothetical protein